MIKIAEIVSGINLFLFIVFCITFFTGTIGYSLLLILVTVTISLILTIISLFRKLKRVYVVLSILPLLIGLLIAFLIYSGLITYVYILFFDELPYVPN